MEPTLLFSLIFVDASFIMYMDLDENSWTFRNSSKSQTKSNKKVSSCEIYALLDNYRLVPSGHNLNAVRSKIALQWVVRPGNTQACLLHIRYCDKPNA